MKVDYAKRNKKIQEAMQKINSDPQRRKAMYERRMKTINSLKGTTLPKFLVVNYNQD